MRFKATLEVRLGGLYSAYRIQRLAFRAYLQTPKNPNPIRVMCTKNLEKEVVLGFLR